MREQELLNQADKALHQAEQNPGKIILVTGGPTCEDIDPIRYITNRSTGKMGIKSAEAARDMGLSPILILGPTNLLITTQDIPIINIRSADNLFSVISHLFAKCTYLLMSAAVADFTPETVSISKLKKTDIQNTEHKFTLTLKRTKDILAELNKLTSRQHKYIAGFSLDTTINTGEGMRKLKEKGLDLIVINSTAAFAEDFSTIQILTRDNSRIELSQSSKYDTAKIIIRELIRLESLDTPEGKKEE